MAEKKYWLPNISPKQEQIMRLRTKFNLITGPRLSSKTRGVLADLVLHAVRFEFPRIAMIGRTQTVNADGGPWAALIRYIIPEWIAAGKTEWVTQPKMDGATHKIYCGILNSYGRESIIQLDSLAVESDVDDRFKGKEYSYIYMTEADNFQYRYSLDVIQECLRGIPGMKPEDYKLILDCNPPKDGEDHWLHDLFYKFRLKENFDDEPDEQNRAALLEMQKSLSVLEFTIDDNIFLTEQQRRAQYAKYAHDKDLLDRYYYGKWVKAAGTSVFTGFYKPMIHTNDTGPDPKNPEIFLPEENCSNLGTSWDIGSANNASHIIEPIKVTREMMVNGVPTMKEVSAFKILDEFVAVGENISIATLVEIMLGKMDFWESQCSGKVWWRHISDRSSFDRFDNIGDTAEYKEVYSESNGRIELERGPVKKKGSVQARVNLIRKLFFQDRLYVSSNCPQTIAMLKNIQPGKHTAIDVHSKWKHAFDSISYFICLICYNEMEEDALLISGRQNPKPKGIISI